MNVVNAVPADGLTPFGTMTSPAHLPACGAFWDTTDMC